MMDEEKTPDINEIAEEKKMGLSLSDTAYYNVNDGIQVPAPEGDGDQPKAEKKRAGGLMFFLLGIIFCLGAMFICTRVIGIGHFITDEEYDYYTGLDASYGKYYEIMNFISQDPIAESEPDEIDDDELKAIVSSIGDPYAEYYTAAEYQELQKRFQGDYVGIGIGVVQEEENIVIKSVFEDTPADEAGILAEDIIIKVDGKEPADVDEAVEMISGDAGTKVNITVKRGSETLDFELKRASIDTDSVGYSVLDGHPDIGYISIVSFINGTDDEFKEAVKALQAEGCDKFIIDLRDNGGGLTDESIEIADYLLPACRIMSENTKDGKETIYNSKASSADLDMVILVNENTASASEILTAALQDNGAGKVIGTVTYGKGVTQIVHQFSDGSAIKITSTEYFRPNGEKVNGVGITPDIETDDEGMLDAILKELEQ